MKDMDLFPQGGREVVRVDPNFIATGHLHKSFFIIFLYFFLYCTYKFKKYRKLIGARYFNKGYAAYAGSLNASYETARDNEGHGTHTLSTAGGNFISGANVFGNGNGTAKGGSPKALVAAYKVCWPQVDSGGGCFDADILAAIEAAISDGVDILSLSLGGGAKDFSEDVTAIGAFHAVQQGIIVVCSAGNSGPAPGTIENGAPWILTVGASTINRDFTSYVALGNKKHIKVLFLIKFILMGSVLSCFCCF